MTLKKNPYIPPPHTTLDLISDLKDALSLRSGVSIVEFAESDDFCHKPLYPRQRVLLKLFFLEELEGWEEDILSKWIRGEGDVLICPDVRKRVEWLRERGYPHFSTIQLVGGRRSSKGYTTGIAIAKKIWDFVQMEDPATRFGVDPDKDIYFEVIAAGKEQAKKHQFADVRSTVESCKALEKYISRIREEGVSIYTPADLVKLASFRARRTDIQRDLARLRVEAFATTASTVRGSAAAAIVIDEMAHMLPGESSRSDEEVFEAAVPSLAQFGKDAILFCNSSPYTETGKFFSLYEDSQEKDQENFPVHFHQLMFQFPSWELYNDWQMDERFRGAIITFDSVAHLEKSNPDKFRVEFRGQFAKTIDAFLTPEKVDAMYEGYFNGRQLETQYAGIALYSPYKGHGDPSSTTANFGIAIAHIEHVVNELTEIEEPHVVFDLIDAWYPEEFEETGGVIDWMKILPEIVGIIDRFRPTEFTFDQFDSTMPIQALRQEIHQRGLSTIRIAEKPGTPKRNRKRCDNFKAALYLGRVHAPSPKGHRSLELSRNELKFLVEKHGKVQRQEIGPVTTKDMADCIMECVDYLIGDHLSMYRDALDVNPRLGAEGGFGRRMGVSIGDFYRHRNKPGAGFNPARGRRGRGHRSR